MKESQLDNKTSIATNDYVRMVDENNNSVKIKKDSFMAAIRDALPSIISDGETGGGSVLSIINGALKTRTDANLASVLGDWLHIKTGEIPSVQSITVTLGSGLLIMAMMSSVEVDILEYWREPQIVSEGQSVFSITKTGNTNSYTITSSQNVGGTYIFIGIG